MNLLSIDWDYFFPVVENAGENWQLYDWGHRETELFKTTIWPIRADSFDRARVALPGTSGKERGFWSRFKFSPNATLYIADSHSRITTREVERNVSSVMSFDAHHDACYNKSGAANAQRGVISCDNWAYWFACTGRKVIVRYPKWRDYAMADEPKPASPIFRRVDSERPVTTEFESIFICRSGSWTPSWLDDAFDAFVQAAPVTVTTLLDDVSNRKAEFEAARAALRVANLGF